MTKSTKWSIDPSHSTLEFKVRHLMISHVKGAFKVFDANIYTTDNDFTTAQIDLWVDASSIASGDLKRDEHLKSADFFDVQNHKQITFTSSQIGEANSKGERDLWGELTLKGITKSIKLNVVFGGLITDPWKNQRAGFTVNGVINRSEWGLAWSESIEKGGVMVGEEIIISAEVELIKSNPADLKMELTSTLNSDEKKLTSIK